MRWLAQIAVVLCFTAPAAADILEWQDTAGVRHYTNVRAGVPKEYRDSAQVVVAETGLEPGTGSSTPDMPASAARPPAPPVVPVSAGGWESRAYWEGLQRGLELGRDAAMPAGVSVTGPLAIANASAPVVTAPALPLWPVYPLITTSFDRGRSRHLTLRMLLQDEFALDREGPFIYGDRGVFPGLALYPFLPRGLAVGQPCARRFGAQ